MELADIPPGKTRAMHPSDNRSAAVVSIIVPCWRDDAVAEAVAARWLAHSAVCEVIVAAACADDCDEPAAALGPERRTMQGLSVIRCPRRGRGQQFNHAARMATGDFFLFHHADTELTDAHLESLRRAANDPGAGGGAFQRRFDERHPRLRWLEPWEARRCRLFGPLFGDQSIFVRRAVFEALGGFADVPLMEDVEFSTRLRRHCGVVLLQPAITSSARKHMQQGRWRTTLSNAFFLLLYLCGIAPGTLHRWYYQRRVRLDHASATPEAPQC
jgi:GT2 family glycosyltransferase